MIFKKNLGFLLVVAFALLALSPSAMALNKILSPEKAGEMFDGHMDAGLEYFARGQYQEAINELLLADQLMLLPFTKYWIAKAYLNLKQFDLAEEYFDQAIKFYEIDVFMVERYYSEACAGKAFLLYKKGEHKKARDYLKIAYKNSDDESNKDLYAIVISIIDELLKR